MSEQQLTTTVENQILSLLQDANSKSLARADLISRLPLVQEYLASRSKDKLLETAGYYRNIIEKEKEAFARALENQNATKVAGRQQEVSRLRDQIERHKIEITRLQDEIGGYLNQADAEEAAVKLESEKLERSKAAFEKAHQSVLLAIDGDVEKMHKYL